MFFALPIVMCFAPEWLFVCLFGQLAMRWWHRINQE